MGSNQNTFSRKFDEELNIANNFSKIVTDGITSVRWISGCFVINCYSSGKSMVRII